MTLGKFCVVRMSIAFCLYYFLIQRDSSGSPKFQLKQMLVPLTYISQFYGPTSLRPNSLIHVTDTVYYYDTHSSPKYGVGRARVQSWMYARTNTRLGEHSHRTAGYSHNISAIALCRSK